MHYTSLHIAVIICIQYHPGYHRQTRRQQFIGYTIKLTAFTLKNCLVDHRETYTQTIRRQDCDLRLNIWEDHTLDVEMRIAGHNDRLSCGIDDARVIAFVGSLHTDNTQSPGSRIHFIVPSYWLKQQSRAPVYTVYSRCLIICFIQVKT